MKKPRGGPGHQAMAQIKDVIHQRLKARYDMTCCFVEFGFKILQPPWISLINQIDASLGQALGKLTEDGKKIATRGRSSTSTQELLPGNVGVIIKYPS